jgi:hypothetical protein
LPRLYLKDSQPDFDSQEGFLMADLVLLILKQYLKYSFSING